MHPAAVLLGLAALGSVAFAHRGKEVSALSMAWAMVALWAAANLVWQVGRVDCIPFLDLPAAMSAYAIWHNERQRWQRAVIDIFLARFVLHAAYPGANADYEIAFLHLLNLMFLAACVVIGWRGVADAVGSFDRFPRIHAILSCGLSRLAQSEKLK